MSDVDYKKLDKLLEFIRGKEKLQAAPAKSPEYKSPLESDTMIVKGESPAPEKITRIKGATDKIDTKQIGKIISGAEHKAKIAALTGLKKKALGIIPMAGAAYGLMSGDPAMAAEEAAGDIPVVGQAYEAIKSEAAGMSPEDEKIMLAEDKARKLYDKSPAKLDRLKAMSSGRAPASSPTMMPTELSSDQAPAMSAQGEMPQLAEKIAPDMQDQIRNKLQQAQELKPEEVRASKLRKLFNLKG